MASIGTQPLTINELYDRLVGKSGKAGRNQLIKSDKLEIAQQLANVSGLPVAAFDLRTLNSPQQTSRARSESLGARATIEGRMGSQLTDWIFIGRITSPISEHASIIDPLFRMLDGQASVAILFGNQPNWRPLAIYCQPNRRAAAEAISLYLGFSSTSIKEFGASIASGSPKKPMARPITLSDTFLDEQEIEDIIGDWKRKKNLILEGPPGVGKTFIIRGLAHSLMGGFDSERFQFIQFHQSFSYEDFIRGWRPIDGKEGFELVDGVFLNFCDQAIADPEQIYVFAIDEINRANVSRVFGELLLLIDAEKRSEDYAVSLSYRSQGADETFFVPENVFVISTMNTADRSLTAFDMAMRRRFAFKYLKPVYESPRFFTFLEKQGISGLVRDRIVRRLSALNKLIAKDAALGAGFEIGHSYFCPREPVSDSQAWYLAIVRSELAPLIREYWFDNQEKAEAYIRALESPEGDVSNLLDGVNQSNSDRIGEETNGSN